MIFSPCAQGILAENIVLAEAEGEQDAAGNHLKTQTQGAHRR